MAPVLLEFVGLSVEGVSGPKPPPHSMDAGEICTATCLQKGFHPSVAGRGVSEGPGRRSRMARQVVAAVAARGKDIADVAASHSLPSQNPNPHRLPPTTFYYGLEAVPLAQPAFTPLPAPGSATLGA
ncbi:hypothetical protein NE237_024407 [Protea cynaroides]|uniref:Uncharacterized protein n=1 Tax=Protea cynaroides TaxID=273540 RepID=A0A9Q0HDU5_9MAGN|nr:hypothetical protein NE237_024407 [Protea cynaroides]